MNKGKTILEMATELDRQANAKKDFTAPMGLVKMNDDGRTIQLQGHGNFQLQNIAKRQLAQAYEIPAAFYDRLEADYPELLAKTVNDLIAGEEPRKMLIRTLDTNARAFLSNRFRTLDNYDLFEACYPVIKANPRIIIESTELTERKLYIKLRLPWLDRELAIPEGLKMGVGHNFFVRKIEASVTISNSETGYGAIAIQPGVFEKQCTNMATFRDEGFGKLHIGKSLGESNAIEEYVSDETKRLRDAAVWAEVRDVLTATMDGRVMDNIVAKLQAARANPIEGNLVDVVEVFAKQRRFNEQEKGGLLKYLVESGEPTQYGLQWAVTRLAGDTELVSDYDRASELERLGGEVIELKASEWREISKAVAAPAKKAA
jgi:hypothetical protein